MWNPFKVEAEPTYTKLRYRFVMKVVGIAIVGGVVAVVLDPTGWSIGIAADIAATGAIFIAGLNLNMAYKQVGFENKLNVIHTDIKGIKQVVNYNAKVAKKNHPNADYEMVD